jgi:hypothetical protein
VFDGCSVAGLGRLSPLIGGEGLITIPDGERNEKFRKMHLKYGRLHPHVQGEFAFVQGELSCCFQCGVCALLGL